MAEFSKINGYEVKDDKARNMIGTFVQIGGDNSSFWVYRKGGMFQLVMYGVMLETLKSYINGNSSIMPNHPVTESCLCDIEGSDQCYPAIMTLEGANLLVEYPGSFGGALESVEDDAAMLFGTFTWYDYSV